MIHRCTWVERLNKVGKGGSPMMRRWDFTNANPRLSCSKYSSFIDMVDFSENPKAIIELSTFRMLFMERSMKKISIVEIATKSLI